MSVIFAQLELPFTSLFAAPQLDKMEDDAPAAAPMAPYFNNARRLTRRMGNFRHLVGLDADLRPA